VWVQSVALFNEHGLPPAAQAEVLYRHILGRPARDELAATAAAIPNAGLPSAVEGLLRSSEYRARFGTAAAPSPPGSTAKALRR
jgi:hypothetical protein